MSIARHHAEWLSLLEISGPFLSLETLVAVFPQGNLGALHAKCAVADRALLFISSANLTGYALTINMELGVIVRGGELPGDVATVFTRLIEHGVLQRMTT